MSVAAPTTVRTSEEDAVTPLLRVTDLHVSYSTSHGPVPAVEGVSFEMAPGEVVAIVGESGSGKTTTAQAIIGMLARNGSVSKGHIEFNGLDLATLSEKEWQTVRGAKIGLIPQDPIVSLNPVKKIGVQVAEVLRIHGLASKGEAAVKAVELLEMAGLTEPAARAQQYPHQLSGGMRQRVLIAAAMACDPALIIADEPTSALDVTVQRHILDHIDRLTHETGAGMLLITHDLGVAADRARRIVVMSKGTVVELGTSDEVLGNPQHPYTKQLIANAPSLSSSKLGAGRLGVDSTAHEAPSAPLLTVSGLTKDFVLPRASSQKRVQRAVDDVSFSIGRGETFSLVGESGSGKSTTARLILRLETPTAGGVDFDGINVTDLGKKDMRLLRQRMQLVYQNPYASLDPRFSIEDVITEPLRSFGIGSSAERSAKAVELIEQVSLTRAMLRRRPAELSGGQRQRVAIARALALDPEFIVCDEAVSALDVSVQAQILDLLVRLQDERGLSYLFISHDLAVVRQVSDHVGVMRHGQLLEVGTVDEIFDAPQHEYTRELLGAIPGARWAGGVA